MYPDLAELISIQKFARKKVACHSSQMPLGSHSSSSRGQGLEFDSVREYVPGDDIRHIDWRVTARTGTPHLKLFQEERERQIVICLDRSPTMHFGTRNTFKSVQAARALAFLGWQGIYAQDRVGVCLIDGNGLNYFPPKRSSSTFCQILKLTTQPADKAFSGTDEVFKKLSTLIPRGSLVYVISDFANFTADNLKFFFKKCALTLIAVNDPAEKSLPCLGLLGFKADEELYVDTQLSQGRKVYTAQWEKQRKKLLEETRMAKIKLIELTTQSNVLQELNRNVR